MFNAYKKNSSCAKKDLSVCFEKYSPYAKKVIVYLKKNHRMLKKIQCAFEFFSPYTANL